MSSKLYSCLPSVAIRLLAGIRRHSSPYGSDRARHQLRARLVFEADSVTSIAHQIGYFHTVADVDVYHGMEAGLAAVTLEDVARVARRYLAPTGRTVGWFEPLPDGPAGSRSA